MTHQDSGQVFSIGAHMYQRRQAARRATVRQALIDARAWLDAGIVGAVSLEAAACSADAALGPAIREVMRASPSA